MKRNSYVEAAKEPVNWMGLGSTFILSCLTLNPIFFLGGVVGSTAWTLLVPDMPWFKRKLQAMSIADTEAESEERRLKLRENTLPYLSEELGARYLRLERTRDLMDQDTSLTDQWYGDIKRQLDLLLERFLVFASKDNQFRTHLQGMLDGILPSGKSRNSTRESKFRSEEADHEDFDVTQVAEWVQSIVPRIRTEYDKEIKYHETLIEQKQASPHLMDTVSSGMIDPDIMVIQKNIEIIKKRRDYADQLGKILINLNYQMRLLESTFGLISDQTRVRPPREILSDVESVVQGTQSLTEMIGELEQVTA